MIAAQLSASEEAVRKIARSIVDALAKRHKLYLLESPRLSSLSGESDDGLDMHQIDVQTEDHSVDIDQRRTILSSVWKHLEPVEQYVIESLVIEDQDANDVLDALKTLDISIKSGVPAEDTSRQQLYYFKRKVLDKLQKLLDDSGYKLGDFFK